MFIKIMANDNIENQMVGKRYSIIEVSQFSLEPLSDVGGIKQVALNYLPKGSSDWQQRGLEENQLMYVLNDNGKTIDAFNAYIAH